ncbi:MAG: RNA-binding protein [Thaumarchaeota archaeon]|nr:RNA-binding protein [Nitrososphaerota archaeon]
MPGVTRKYVVPGELIVDGKYRLGANVYANQDKVYSTRVGLAEISRGEVRVIPLSGVYIPRVDDFVIGKITDYSAFAWEVDIASCFLAFLPAQSVFGRDYSPAQDSMLDRFKVGDLIAAKIAAFDRTRDPLVSVSGPGLGLINKGEIVKIMSTKVPRLIGKKGSMIKTVEAGTGCRLSIGQNGLIVVMGPPEGIAKALETIRLIEQEAHTADLTQKVEALLAESGGA